MNQRLAISLLNRGAGLMDGLTGILLILSPGFTFRLMGISFPEDCHVFASYLGVFVFSVGVAHFLAGGFPADAVARERWKTIWLVTSIVRLSVAAFVSAQIILGGLTPGWASVAATDFCVALLFLFLLQRRLLATQ